MSYVYLWTAQSCCIREMEVFFKHDIETNTDKLEQSMERMLNWLGKQVLIKARAVSWYFHLIWSQISNLPYCNNHR